MTILAIDPGPVQSAWVELDGGGLDGFAIRDNGSLLEELRETARLPHLIRPDHLVIEQIASYGMPVGAEVFETVYWSGRFAEAAHPIPVDRLPRLKVKTHLCHDSRAKDSNVRQALLDRWGGKDMAVGRKARPGPLYGLSGDCWSALAVAVTWADTHEEEA